MLKNVKSDRFATLPGVTKNYGGLDSSDSRTKTKKKIIEYEYYDEDYDYYDDYKGDDDDGSLARHRNTLMLGPPLKYFRIGEDDDE